MAAVADRQKELDGILDEMKKLQDYYDEKDPETGKKRRWNTDDRERFERLAEEGFDLQKDLENEAKMEEIERRREEARKLGQRPTLPASRSEAKMGEREIAGYVSIGDYVVMSEAVQKAGADGWPVGTYATVQLAAALNGKNAVHDQRGNPLVPLNRAERKLFERTVRETKAAPTLGTGVIEPDRLARIPQVDADDRLRIRDVISTGQTSSGSVEYAREESVTGDAAAAEHGSEKAELGMDFTLQNAPVRTIAGWMPVQNQQLEDWAQLRSLIDGRLRYRVNRREEEEVLYGDGSAPSLEGIGVVSGTQDISANGRYSAAEHTLIDVVRMGISDVMVAGYEANAVVLHPFDWETIVLEKGTDDRYVWVVVTDNNGSRIWGVRAVEAVGAQSRDTGQRNIFVGDWLMGAQLLDRMNTTIQVGLIDRQFVENMRTILAEERIALPIYAPAAFALFETVAASS